MLTLTTQYTVHVKQTESVYWFKHKDPAKQKSTTHSETEYCIPPQKNQKKVNSVLAIKFFYETSSEHC